VVFFIFYSLQLKFCSSDQTFLLSLGDKFWEDEKVGVKFLGNLLGTLKVRFDNFG
jgi:hypothetical protein